MFDVEVQAFGVATEIKVRIAKGMQIGRSPEGLTTALVGGAFAGMMGDNDAGVELSLKRAQIGEQRSNLARDVLVDGVQPHQGVEAQQGGAQPGNGGTQSPRVVGAIEPEGRHADDVNVEGLEIDAGSCGDALQTLAQDGVAV